MRRGRSLVLVDWDAAHGAEIAKALSKEGWDVHVESDDGARACKHMADDPPDVLVVDLRRLAIQGRETARGARALKDLHELPVVFLDDAGTGREKAAGAVPDAVFTTLDDLVYVLNRLGIHPTS